MRWFAEGGVIMWAILISALLMIGYAAAAYRARRTRREQESAAARRDAVLFWGAFAAGLGLLGTLVGFAEMAQAIEAAGRVSQGLAWGGVRVALVSTVFGLLVLLGGLLLWFGLYGTRSSGSTSRDGIRAES